MSPDSQENTAPPRPARRWGRIVIISILSLLLILTGGVIWLFSDKQRVKTGIETLVSNLTERPFLIKGEFDFHLGSEIRILATDVEWANAPWSNQPTMLTIASADVSVALGSLLNPPIIISNAIASGARLDFEWGPDRKSNWLLVRSDKPKRDKPLAPLPLLLETADLGEVELHFKHPALKKELVIEVSQANSQQDEQNRLVVDINAAINDRPIDIDGRIGPFPELVVAGAVNFQLHGNGPVAAVNLEGAFGNLARLQEPDLQFQLAAPEITAVLSMLSLPTVTSGQLDLQGGIQSGNDAIDGTIKGVIGEFDVDATLHADSLKSLDGLSANIASQGPSTATAGNALGIGGLPPEPYELKISVTDTTAGLKIEQFHFTTADATATASGIIHDFPKLNSIDLELKADVPNIEKFQGILPGTDIPQVPLQLSAAISSDMQGAQDNVTADATLGQSNMQVTGSLTQDPQFIGSSFDFKARLPNLQQLGKLTGINLLRSASLTAKGNLKVTGDGIRLNNTSGNIEQQSFDVGGDINFIATPFNTSLAFNASGNSIAETIALFVVSDRIPALPYQLAGQLAFAGKQLNLDRIRGTLGSNSITADGFVILKQKLPDIDLQISATGPDLNDLLQGQGIDDVPAKPFSVKTKLRLDDAGISASNIDFRLADDKLLGSISSGWPDKSKEIAFNLTAYGANLSETLPAIPGYLPANVKFETAFSGDFDDDHINFDDLKLVLGGANIRLTGRLDLPPNLQAKNVKLQASGPRLSDLGATPNMQFPGLPFNISATMGGTLNSIHVKDFSAKAGENDLQGTFTLDYTDKAKVELNIQSNLIDLRTLLEPPTADSPAESTDSDTAVAANSTKKNKRLIPDYDLPLETLKSFDAAGTLNIGQIIADRLYLKNLSIDADLNAGALDVHHLKAETQKGVLEGSFTLTPNSGGAAMEATATAKNLVLAIGELDETLRKDHPGQDIDLHLTGQGANLRDMAGSLDGFIWLRGGQRQIASAQLGLLFGDFLTQVIETINPFSKKDPYQTLECDRIFFEANAGVLETSPAILFRTDKINVRSVGALSLKTEKIDFAIETSPRKGIGLSASDLVNPFIKIGGTMASPGLIPDATGTLIEGGAAVATMGLSIVAKSMYKRWLSPRDPCTSLTENARAIRTKRNPDHVPAD